MSNVDALPHHEGKEWASLLSAQLSSRCAGSTACYELEDLGVTDFVELGPGGVLTGMAKRTVDQRPHDLGRHARGARQAASSWSRDGVADRPGAARGRAPLRQRAPRRQPGRRRLHARRRDRRRHDDRGRHRCSATSASTRCARRSPASCRATSPSTASGSRPASRSPGCGRAEAEGPTHACHPSRRPRRRHHRVGHRAARQDRSPTTTSPTCLDTSDEWIVERTGIRERRVGGTTAGLSAEAGRLALGDVRASTRRRSTPSCWPPPRPTAPCRPRRPRCSTSSGCAAARSTSTPPARASSTRSSSPTA